MTTPHLAPFPFRQLSLHRAEKLLHFRTACIATNTKRGLHVRDDVTATNTKRGLDVRDDVTVTNTKRELDVMIIIITTTMYIYHALINALSAYMIHINLNMIFYTHVKHSPTKTIYIKYYYYFLYKNK